jgi:hypothetical protein
MSTDYEQEVLKYIQMAIAGVDIALYLSKLVVVILIIISLLPTGTLTYAHLYGNGVQQWINKDADVKIQFKYTLYKPEIHHYHQLNFSIQDVTGKHLKNLTASVTITNDPLFAFDNITIPNGDFAVVCPFLDQGQHQVIVYVRNGSYALALASFNMTVSSLSETYVGR